MYVDLDGDGYGDPLASELACVVGNGHLMLMIVMTLKFAWNGALEVCDGVENIR